MLISPCLPSIWPGLSHLGCWGVAGLPPQSLAGVPLYLAVVRVSWYLAGVRVSWFLAALSVRLGPALSLSLLPLVPHISPLSARGPSGQMLHNQADMFHILPEGLVKWLPYSEQHPSLQGAQYEHPSHPSPQPFLGEPEQVHAWTLGHRDILTLGHLDIWILGQLVTWTLGYLDD